MAEKVVEACKGESGYKPLYSLDLSIEEKIETIAKEIYGANGVEYSAAAKKSIAEFNKLGADKMPVCIAKLSTAFRTTQSFSADLRILHFILNLWNFQTEQDLLFAEQVLL